MGLNTRSITSAKDCILRYRYVEPPDKSPPKYRKVFRAPIWRSTSHSVVSTKITIRCKRSSQSRAPNTRDYGFRSVSRPLGLLVALPRRRYSLQRQPSSLSHLNLAPVLTLPRTTKPQRDGIVPLRSVTKDCVYLYETRSGISTHSSQLGLQSRLFCRTSPRGFAHMYTARSVNAPTSSGLSERLYGTYANRTMSSDTSKQLGLGSRLIDHRSGCKVAQFYASRPVSLHLNSMLQQPMSSLIRRTKDLVTKEPKAVNAIVSRQFGKWYRPFLPKSLQVENAQTYVRKSRLISNPAKINKLPTTALHMKDTELARSYNPQSVTPMAAPRIRRTQGLYSETGNTPITSDVGLRLRLNLHLSPLGMSHLYPANKVYSPPSQHLSRRIHQSISNHNEEKRTSEELYTSMKSHRMQSSNTITSTRYGSQPVKTLKYTSELDLKTRPKTLTRNCSNFAQHYPTEISKVTTSRISLRPLSSPTLKTLPRRNRILSDIEDDEFENNQRLNVSKYSGFTLQHDRPLRSAANDYVHLYTSHPENLPSSLLGDRIKLSLRSSTSKVACLYAAHPVDSETPERRHRPKSKPTWRIPDKYSADKYVPRPGLMSCMNSISAKKCVY